MVLWYCVYLYLYFDIKIRIFYFILLYSILFYFILFLFYLKKNIQKRVHLTNSTIWLKARSNITSTVLVLSRTGRVFGL